MNKRTVIATLPFAALVVFAAGWWATAGSLTPPSVGPTVPTDRVTLSDLLTPLPVFIGTSGSYVLTSDLNDNGAVGITIAASDVDIDLNGFAIIGMGSPFDGIIALPPSENVTVHDGEVRDWGLSGVDLSLADRVHVYNLAVTSNALGGLSVGSNSRIDSVRADGNANAGILTGPSSVVTNCTASNNGFEGLFAGTDTRVVDCVAQFNGSPSWAGFFCPGGCSFEGCTAQYNGTHGFEIWDGSVIDCVANSNSQDGILASSSLIERNSVVSNAVFGIEVYDACGVVDNQVSQNWADGIFVWGDGNRIEENHLVFNGGFAIDTLTAAAGMSNVVLSNREHGNPGGYNLDFGSNTWGPIFGGPGQVTTFPGLGTDDHFVNISY